MKIKTIILLAVAAIALLLGIYKIRSNTRNVVDQLESNKQLINVLVCGSNRFNDNKHRFFAVLSVNPVTKSAGMIFLPPSFEVDEENDGNGVKLQDTDVRDFGDISDAIYKSLKIKCQFYAIVYAPDVRRSVDIMEGLNIFFSEPMEKVFGSHLGMNYLDGMKTVNFINSSNESIYKKYDRVQDIVFTLFDARESYRPFISKPVAEELKKTIKTNMMPNEIVSFGKLLSDCSKIQCANLPGRLSDEGSFVLDEVAFKIYEDSYLRWLIVNEKRQPNIRVRILNATDISGLAKKTRNLLMREGISVVEFGTSTVNNLEKSVIINNKGNTDDLKLISELTGIPTIQHSVDSTQLHDATILIGKDMAK